MATGVLEAHPSVGDDASSMEEVVDHQEVDEKVQQVGGKRKKVKDETEEGGVGEEDEKEEAQELEEEEVRTPEIKVRKRRSVSKQQATPIERPSREKRVVERYSSSAPRRNSSSKSVPINQGSGTKLRDIPNVLFKLSKRKADESLQHLHRIFFGKKAKAHYLKRSLLEFSGFVWAESKEKEKSKLNDKLDRCVKDKLLDFCDVLDISVARATTKKEDLVSLLLDFLQSPHVTRDVSLEKKELAKKRKRAASKTGSEKKSGEKTKRQRRRSTKIEEDENDVEVKEEDKGEDEDEDVGNANNNGVDGSEKDSDLEKNDPEEETKESGPRTLQKSPDKKERKRVKSIANVEKITSGKKISKKNETLKRKRQRSSTTNIEKSSPNKRGSAKTKSQKNKSKKNKDSSTEEKSTDKIQGTRANSGKTVLSSPTLKELHDVVSDILKEVDFNTATLADILKQLGTHFGMNLSDRKADVKNIIEDVISNMTDDENEDGEGDNNEVEEKKDSVEEKSEGDDDTEKTPEKIENREESFEEEDGAQEKDDGAQEEDDSAQEEDDGVQEEDDGVQEEDGAQEDDGVEEDDDAKEVEEKKYDAKETPEGGDVMNNSVKIGNKEVDKNVQEDDEDA